MMLPSFVVVFWQTVEQKMSGKELNPVLMDIYKQGVSARDTDIRNVIRYGTVKKAYNFERGFQGNFRRKESYKFKN